MQSEEKMKTFVESKLKENTGNNALNLSAVVPFADKGGGPTGASMNAYLKNIQQWQERLTNYLHNMSADLEPDQWEELETSLGQFHEDVLLRYGDDGGFHMSSEEFAKKATDAVKYLKNGKLKINKAYEELYDDDPESEAKRVLSGIVDDVILLVDGGRPFQRIDIDWVDPTTDEDFNRQMYEFSSAEQILPDAEAIPWLVPASHQESKVLPRDLLKRLTTPLKCGDVDDHEDWEYSVTNPAELEEQYASFEPTFERLRVNLKAVLTEEIQNHSSNVDTTASINPAEVEEAARKLEAGEVNIDFKSLFILPYDVNLCKLVGVRDDSVGDLVAYKEVVKPPSERIADKNLRSDPKAWVDPDRPAGPHIRTYGWEPFADLGDDVAPEESEVVKKKENPDAFRADSILSSGDKARIDKRIQSLKKSVADRIAMKNYSDGLSSVNPDVKNYLDRKGQRFGIIPESFSTPEELLNSLDMPKLRENGSKVISMENEIIPIDPDWVGLDGSGEPHESLVEERYWKQLESFKKPPAAPLVDWKSILSQDLEGSEDPEDEELRKYLEEVTESHHKKEIEKPQEPVNQKVGKDTPARKRQLDEQFVKQWVDRFGSDEGIQGLDPKSFKIPEHLVSSEEYEEKYLTHPYTSSYVFHPNFVRFRRMTKNHPTYAEYAFEKLEPASTVNCDDNLKEFESVLAQLDEQGPLEKVEDVQQLNEKNFRIDPDEAKKWDSEFSSHMTEGLNLLESFAERMRKEFVKPETPCKEEESDERSRWSVSASRSVGETHSTSTPYETSCIVTPSKLLQNALMIGSESTWQQIYSLSWQLPKPLTILFINRNDWHAVRPNHRIHQRICLGLPPASERKFDALIREITSLDYHNWFCVLDLLFARLDKYPKPDSLLEFHLEPFTLENFGSLPVLGQTNDVKVEEKLTEKLESSDTSSGSDDSDSEDEDVQSQLVNRTVEWRPIKKFSGYQGANVLQLLSDASQLLESSVPKHFHPPPRVMEWIQGKYQPSTNRLKKWRKLYSSLFPNTDSPLHTPYLFLTEDEKLAKLQKQTKEPDSDDPWALTKEEKSALKASKKAGQKSAEASETTEEPSQDGKDAERLTNLEELSGIRRVLQLRDEQWAEELDTQEAPDMSTLGTPAMEFPFELDKFQKQAIMALEKGYNVFVSAHTSAGKTAVAEYAIAMSRKRRSRAIYTSPIKALSNQKYNDFKKCFDSVGLITGDVQLNESADCLIMTTEILRSMLYNSSEGVRDLEFVVLDEVHYLNDRERGHVWEEVLILLPDNVQIVMLSATVPNTMEFASWVGRNKKRKVMVCKTLKRPVPLKHYFYADVSKIKNMDPSLGKFLLKDGDNPINTTQWEEIRHLIKEIDRIEKEERKKIRQKLDEKRAQNNYGRGGNAKVTLQELESESSSGSGLNKQEMMTYYHKKERKHWVSFINYLKDIEWMPTIVFAFSRKKCDELADLLNTTELSPLTTEPERRCIKAFIKSQVNKLDDEDKNLPQIQTLSKHLQNGIGVHHSGILPVLKEIVEFLFQQGKVKLLIATETFAMGVNMPARTVVFYSIKKFDGSEQRFLHPAEYIQMAGRAGRRGEDTVGNVIIKCQSRDAVSLTIGDIESMMTGAPCTLTSQFRISYRMLLNTLTTGSKITAVNMMAQSYHENHGQQELLKRKVALRQVTREEDELKQDIYSSLSSDVIDVYSRMYDAANIYLNMWCNLRDSEAQTSKFAKEVAVGKFIKFHCGIVVDKIGLIVSVTAKPIGYRVLALRDYDGHAVLEPPPDGNASERWYQFLSVLRPPSTKKQLNGELDMRLLIYDIKPKDVIEIYKDSVPLTEEKANTLVKSAQLANIGGRTKSDGELENICFKLHCASSMKQIDEGTFAKDNPEDWEFYQLLKFTEMELKKSIECTNESGDRTRFIETFFKIFKWKEILKKKENLDQIVLEKTMTGLYPEYSSKMEILMHMKYIIDDRVQMKGYMAARISKYELVLTEMLVRNVLKDLSPEEVVGLMAFIVYQTRGAPSQLEEEDKENPAPTPKLQQAIKDTIKIIEELTFEEKSRDIFSEELINLVNAFGLTHIMYSWAKQESFCKVISMAFDFQEGMLVRWIQQLVEALKEIESAARVMGNNDLPKKIQDAIKTIKRGIVFSPSLYTTL